jgi:formylglycine-generating enzyme required for sulfatase activity/tRNA A-37 threonylcarbamoyl transferase component Bud32
MPEPTPAAPDGDAPTVSLFPYQQQAESASPSGPPPAPGGNGPPLGPPGYEIVRELGRGGMGVVYEARHRKLRRTVALKMILAGNHSGATDLARFRTEAETIARLQHPNIIQIHEVGEHGGLPYLALEFCAGGSLEKKLAAAPLLPCEAAALVEKLARAMHAAHQKGVIHRDLKPANVLLAEGGAPKVTDFGLAKKLDEAGQTATGAVMGTPSYMAPEQAEARKGQLGPLADVYALGAVLYECLTGRPPFKAATAIDTLLQVVADEPVPPRQLQPKVPRDLETICLKCLHKEPHKRYASAEALADDLRRFLAGEPIRARPVGTAERAVMWARRHRAVTALAATVLLVAALGVAGILWKYLDAERQKGIAQRNEEAALKEAEKATKARDFLVRTFRKAETDEKGANVTVRQLLDEADSRIPVEFADQPELRADLAKAVADVRRGIGRRTPQAMILEVSGAVRLQSAAGVPRPAVPQALLNLDDRLTLAADAQARLVFLADFHKERLRPGREATIDFKGCAPAEAVLERDDSVLMTFVPLPKATFYMGWDGAAKPPKKGRKTQIKEDFEIAAHDVTQGQWQAVMGDNPSYFSRQGKGRNNVVNISDEELKLFPVEMVSWEDAQKFIAKLNEKERGRGYLYRGPTAPEWEYACRGGATSEEECAFHFYFDRPTNELSSAQANFDGSRPFGQAPKGEFLERTTRVGAYPSNRLGLCDMHGNVCQWFADDFGEDANRVAQGGSWNRNGSSCRAAYRLGYGATLRDFYLGFRLARVPAR